MMNYKYNSIQGTCLSQCSIAMKRHYDWHNSYKRKHLVGTCLKFDRFNLLHLWQGSWGQAGRHRAGEVAESSKAVSPGSRKESHWACLGLLKTSNPVAYLFQRDPNPLEECRSLVTKLSDQWACVVLSHSVLHSAWSEDVLIKRMVSFEWLVLIYISVKRMRAQKESNKR